MYYHNLALHLVNYSFIGNLILRISRFSVLTSVRTVTPCPSPYFYFPFFLQLHVDIESLFPHLHGTGLGLLCVHDCQEYCAGEGAAAKGDPEGHGGHQRRYLVHLVHRQLPHDGH